MARDINHRLLALGVACLLVAAGIGSVATGALAQESTDDESNVLDGWLQEDEPNASENGWLDTTVDTDAWKTRMSATSAAFSGQFDRMQASFNDYFGDDDSVRSNNETVAQTKTEINQNAERYVDAINNRTTPSTAFDTHKVIVSHEGSNNSVLYLTGNVTTVNDTTTLEGITALNESEFNATYDNRSIDETWGVDGHFAEDLPTVADTLANRIANNESLGREYQGKLLGRYCGTTSFTDPGECDVRSTVWMDADELDVEEWTPDDEEDSFLPFTVLAPGFGLGLVEVRRRAA